jgi:hypothetical protein
MGRQFTTDRILVRFFPHFVGVVVFGQALWAGPGVLSLTNIFLICCQRKCKGGSLTRVMPA